MVVMTVSLARPAAVERGALAVRGEAFAGERIERLRHGEEFLAGGGSGVGPLQRFVQKWAMWLVTGPVILPARFLV